ncbi:carboxylesterase [Chitinophaga sp. sic0106]|uniref:alpha/beta hydrolase n=1 Tax=Chitinophaga sp. sic0106 TaxID=2854785 RepID=UPI001C440D72|nr:alpha/beta fold hydrolase [Chitinophaga sp. sic0106]MBV7531537.1 alpha/beta fold hydrolase [Chitinophaga sp. sic0106]
MKRRPFRIFLIVISSLLVVYMLGPKPATPVYDDQLPAVPQQADSLDAYIRNSESALPLKPDNEARIVWADSLHQKTAYAIVYLHGFSASQEEGNPVHREVARRFGCNLYLSRLDAHGLRSDSPLLHMTAEGLWQDAKKALAIGKAIGHKVIVMGTSTGGTLALKLAAEYPQEVYALVNMSPNIAINDKFAFLANDHWGLQLARLISRGEYRDGHDTNTIRNQYWYNRYRLEAVVQLEELLETTMTRATFEKVKQPVLNLYYYKNEQHQDPTVKVEAILAMEKELGTAAGQKAAIAIPGAGAHVMGSSLTSKAVPEVIRTIDSFATGVLKMRPVNQVY